MPISMEAEAEAVSSRVLNSDDRISRLPDSIICHILSFLDTKLVVTTSILSKRWKLVWTGVTALDFEESGIDSDDEDLDDEEKEKELLQNNGIKNIVQFVDKVLLQHDAKSLEKFHLIGREGCKRELVHVDRWISYAMVRNVKSLTICVSGSVKIQLPAAIFTSGTLAFLSLSRYFMVKLPPVVCLPKLEDLGLHYLFYESDECVSRLLSGCPVLHSLTIFRHSQDQVLAFRVSSPSLKRLEMYLYPDNHNPGPDEILEYDGKLAIDAPNLEYLEIADHVSCQVSITRLTAAKSVDVDLDLAINADADECDSVVKLVEALHSVQFLTLKGRIMKYLSHATIPMSATFDRLTKLNIYYECCHWSSLSVLLGCMMKLETLKNQDYKKSMFQEDSSALLEGPQRSTSMLVIYSRTNFYKLL